MRQNIQISDSESVVWDTQEYSAWWKVPGVPDEMKPRWYTHPEEFVWAAKYPCGCWTKAIPCNHSPKEWAYLLAGGTCPDQMTVQEYKALPKKCAKHRMPQTQKMF